MTSPQSAHPGTTPFHTAIRESTQDQHTEANNAWFITDLLNGAVPPIEYTRYTEQLLFVYRALEERAEELRGDPVAGPFVRRELLRVPSLERDLTHLHGGDHWRETVRPLEATAAYARRVLETAREWPGGYVAHHYTRYMGDLAGGQAVRGAAEKHFGLAHKGDGVRFYVFEDIPNPAAFKRDYRALLDAIPADETERARIIGECRNAFSLNTAVFRELSGSRAEAA